MIYIEKFSPTHAVQQKLIELRTSITWKNISENDTDALRIYFDSYAPKEELRQQLWKNQHGLCAYCMKQLEAGSHARSDRKMKIEHWHPLSKYKNEALDYRNLLGACMGGEKSNIPEGTKRNLCCDSKKGEREIVLDPTNRMQMESICYKDNGTVVYYQPSAGVDEEYIKTINENINTDLQLNGVLDTEGRRLSDTATQIVKSRKDAYSNYKSFVEKLDKRRKLTSKQIEKTIETLLDQEQYVECVGVIIFYLQRKKRQLEHQGR